MTNLASFPGQHYQFYDLGGGCYAAQALPGSGAGSNSGFVDGGTSVILFDTSQTQQAAEELRTAITHILAKPISYVINSHWHGDHIRGNQVFSEAAIVAPAKTHDLMAQLHPSRIDNQKHRLQEGELAALISHLEESRQSADTTRRQSIIDEIAFLHQIELSLPTLQLTLPATTFEHQWIMPTSARKIECRALGAGHTACDAVLWIPDEGICFMGDLLAAGEHLRIIDGNITHWIEILEEIKRWEVKRVVPGHGSGVTEPDWNDVIQYLLNLLQLKEKFLLQGKDPTTLSLEDIPAMYQSWAHPEIFLQSMRHLMEENKGITGL